MDNNPIDDILNIKLFPVSLSFWKENLDYLFSIKEQLLNTNFGLLKRKGTAIEEFTERIKANKKDLYDLELDLSDELYHIDKIYPEIVYNSAFIYAYSFLEISLKKLKKIIDQHIINKKEIINLNKKLYKPLPYTVKSKLYIEKASGIDLINEQELWDSIDKKREVRNAIVHNASNADKLDLQTYLKNDDNFEFDEKTNDFYIKKLDFVFNFITDCETYLNFLHKQLSDIDENMYN